MKIAVLALVLAACSTPTVTGTTCKADADCNLFNVQGTCQPTGFCSYPDDACAGGQRYSPGAGSNLANTCIGGEQPCGAKDQVCCGTGTCGPNLSCAGEARTCQCGGATQACCDGTTCTSGLTCHGDGTCGPPNVTQVAVGNGHICALTTDRDVYCWGFDGTWDVDVPGHRTSVVATLTPTKIANVSNVVEIRAAEHSTCAREADGTLWCWGHNEHGQLGDGTTTSNFAAVQVAGLSGVTMFDGGRFHFCAVGAYMGANGLWCWGRNGQKTYKTANPNFSRLGNNATADSPIPVAVDMSSAAAMGQTVKALATGKFHSCAVMSDNKVWCWGGNSSGQLGNGLTTDTKAPVQVNLAGITIPTGVTVDEVRCSDGNRGGSTCLRLSNGAVYCWGNNGNGQLGDGTTTSRNTPSLAVTAPALGNATFVEIAVGSTSACGRASDTTVWCWGDNTKGMLGDGLAAGGNYSTPLPVLGLTGATQVDLSHRTSCAVDGMNRLFCWGNNQRGQIALRRPAGPADASVLQPVQILP